MRKYDALQGASTNFVPCATFDPSLTIEAAKTIGYIVVVGSRLDYCNSLLAGTSVSNLTRLKLVQNTHARIMVQKSLSKCVPLTFVQNLHGNVIVNYDKIIAVNADVLQL